MEHAVINFILGPNSRKVVLLMYRAMKQMIARCFLQRLPSGMSGLGDRSGGRFNK